VSGKSETWRPAAGSVASLFFGLKAAVLAIVLQAVHRVASAAAP
jgi:chromate transport protein ChrA